MTPSFPPHHLRHPAVFLAAGFGSGLAPKAPGTAGTLVGVLIWVLVLSAGVPLWAQMVGLAVATVFGFWVCEAARRQLGVDDHPGIVWDEMVGFWLAVAGQPLTWPVLVLGFLLFRLFDIAKPWPVGWADKRLKGGFGIMVDDILAGIMAALVLWSLRWLFGF